MGFMTATGAGRIRAEGILLPAPRADGVDEGEILLGELNCQSCHPAPETLARRLNARGAPRLGAAGLRLTPQWLRAWLANPAALTPGTTMPQVLHGTPTGQAAEAIESLTHYLVSLQSDELASPVAAEGSRAERGRVLFHSVGCVACHAPLDQGDATEEAFSQARANSVPLGDLERKYPAGELVRFLRDPVAHRPGGRMPSLGLSEAEAVDLATYLLPGQLLAAAAAPVAPVPGIKWDYFEGSFNRCAQLAEATPVASGVADELGTSPARRDSHFGLRFTGLIQAPVEGEYTFWTRSDDGSQILIGGRTVVDNDGEHAPSNRRGRIQLTPGLHSFEVLFFQAGGGFEFAVDWAGPGFERGPIPASALQQQARRLAPLGAVEFAVDPVQTARGREWYERLNCGACHTGAEPSERRARPMLELAANSASGCLADTVPPGAVRYDLSDAQRTALRATVARVAELNQPGPADREVEITLTRLNCYACHARDGVGGPEASGHAAWFKLVGEADLGEEGRLPPLLNGVGAKLKPAWLADVLLQGTKVRPYMATRMPRYGDAQATALSPLLRAADQRKDRFAEPQMTERDAKFGWKLVGRDGLSCTACHTFTTLGSMGIPALGLDSMHRRLEWDWFRRYLPDPAALRPGTRMPTFWPDGHAVNQDLLAGDTGAQIQAIWAYLAGGPDAEVPAGLIRGRKELVAETEPLIYRNFIEGAGTRAIGVGYPERANLAFDAEQLRLALIWQGSFIDAARHSTDRGVGFEPPLGDHRISFPAGPALAVLSSPDAPWPAAVNQRFRGYRLNSTRQPALEYSVEGVKVTDTFRPRPGEVDMGLERTLKLEGEPGSTLWFRAASGQIRPGPEGVFVVDDKLKLTFHGGEPRVVGAELRVPVAVPGELIVEMVW